MQKFKSEPYFVGGRQYFATRNFVGDFNSMGRKLTNVVCINSKFERKKPPTVIDKTKTAKC